MTHTATDEYIIHSVFLSDRAGTIGQVLLHNFVNVECFLVYFDGEALKFTKAKVV